MNHLITPIAAELDIEAVQVNNTLKLLEEGNTVPFIARYRKEMTKGLDEEQIRFIQEKYEYQVNLEKRKEDVKRLIETQGKLTDDIAKEIDNCSKLSAVEDIYRPYQQKRKTRATDAVAKGLKPLAEWILTLPVSGDLNHQASQFLSEDVSSVEDAIQGAKDIIAEMASDNVKIRDKIRTSIYNYGKIVTKEKKKHEDLDHVYKMYYEFNERLSSLQPHRIMAINRAEKEKVVSVSMDYDENYLYNFAIRAFTFNKESIVNAVIEDAVKDGLKRLAFASVEREIRSEFTANAHEKSIDVFSYNVERLLCQPPTHVNMILGVDPAFRTGCKLAVIDQTGKVLKISVFYPHPPINKPKEAKQIFLSILKEFPIEIIAIGNGTASRETESFIANIIKEENLNVVYTIVSEAGASVYSASDLARKEFPDLQVEQRSAVSIARRVLDPLSELIKIDPKSIGVGQYQHDLPVKRLEERLDFVVSKTVNRIGVDVNTASEELLKNISGITKPISSAIVEYRNKNGKITSRDELKSIKKFTAKSFQQAAGFMRIVDGEEILDTTSIHPESYPLAYQLIKHYNIESIGSKECIALLSNLNVDALAKEFNTDTYTIEDIIDALCQPQRDYRDQYDGPVLKKDVLSLEDLVVGMELEGVVRNVVDFGAFIDIGLKNDGLAHISKLAKTKVKHPSDVVAIGDIVKVWISGIDLQRKKVQLSLIEL